MSDAKLGALTLDFDAMYGAVSSQDKRFDGQFYTAVHTTGIYCRPSCPARTPKAANVSFYPTSAAAHLAGFRACKRCQPEAVPGTPAWNLGNDVASRAMRLIGDGLVDREGTAGLARRMGYSERQLSRVLRRELGAGPLALARAHRARTARTLLMQTEMPFSDVAFAAGFASIRAFNETIKEVFQLTPGQIRTGPGRGTAHKNLAEIQGSISLFLPFREPLNAEALFAQLAARSVAGIEVTSSFKYERYMAISHGSAHISVGYQKGKLQLIAQMERLDDLPQLLSQVRQLLDLDSDPEAVDQAFENEPLLAAHISRHRGARCLGTIDPYETFFKAAFAHEFGQAAVGELLAEIALRAQSDRPEPGAPLMFPTAGEIVAHLPASPSMRRVREIAAAVAAGNLMLGIGSSRQEMLKSLHAQGDLSASIAADVVSQISGDPDVLIEDALVRTGAERLGLPHDLANFAENFRPWRSYLKVYLRLAAGSHGDGRFPPAYAHGN